MKIVCGIPAHRGQAFLRTAMPLSGCILGALILCSCGDRSQQMEEQLTQLQKKVETLQGQLETAKRDLAGARDELDHAKSAAAPAPDKTGSESGGAVSPPSKAVLEESYTTAAKALRHDIDSRLSNFSVDSCTLHTVQMPESSYPFNSKISFSLRSRDGKAYQMDIPVKANYDGKWIFPDTDEIVSRIEAARNARPISETAARSSAAGQDNPHSPPPIMAVDGTVMIQWPNAKPTAANVIPASAPPRSNDEAASPAPPSPPPPAPSTRPAAAPPAPERKPPVMPYDRDVLIKFN